jgi:DNA helicase IV
VRNELLALQQAGLDDSSIAVACLDSYARDLLRENTGFVSYEEARPGHVVCETVHRLKGLEYAAVVVVASRWPVDDKLLYIGISRAVFGLSVIGPIALGERLRLVDA